jgi:hypothetical protein
MGHFSVDGEDFRPNFNKKQNQSEPQSQAVINEWFLMRVFPVKIKKNNIQEKKNVTPTHNKIQLKNKSKNCEVSSILDH